MNIMQSVNSATNMLRGIGKALSMHKPELKVGFGIAGNVASLFWMYKKAPEIKEGIEEKDYVKAIKAASGPVSLSVASNVSIGSGFKDIKADLNTAATAAAMYDTMLTQRMNAEKEVLTKGKQQEVDHQIAKDIADKVSDSSYPIIDTGLGDSLIFDPLSKRLIRSDIGQLNDIFYELGTAVCCGERVYMDEFWSSIPNVLVTGYEHIAGFDLEKGIPSLRIEPVDRGPNAEIMHVMLWKNVVYFTNDDSYKLDGRYLDAPSNFIWQ